MLVSTMFSIMYCLPLRRHFGYFLNPNAGILSLVRVTLITQIEKGFLSL